MTSELGSGHFWVSIQSHDGWRLFDKNIFDKSDIYYSDTNSCIIKEVRLGNHDFSKGITLLFGAWRRLSIWILPSFRHRWQRFTRLDSVFLANLVLAKVFVFRDLLW